MRDLAKIGIHHAILSNRIMLARFGKDPTTALDTRDAMSEFWQAIVSFAFGGKVPECGAEAEVSFGGGDEQFEIVVRRLPAKGMGG